jgi:hypothetical protein
VVEYRDEGRFNADPTQVLASGLGDASSYADIAIALAIVGLDTGIFSSPNNSALMGAAPRHRQGSAASVLATARNGGMVLGVGLAGAIFATVQAQFGGTIFDAISAGLLAAAGVTILGAFTSAVRGQREIERDIDRSH